MSNIWPKGNQAAFVVRTLAILFALAGITGAIGGGMLLRESAADATVAMQRLRTELGPEHNVGIVEASFRTVAWATIAISTAAILAATALWRRHPWARPIAMGVALIGALWWGAGALSVAMSPWRWTVGLLWNLLGLAVCAGVLHILTLRDIRRFLRHNHWTPARRA